MNEAESYVNKLSPTQLMSTPNFFKMHISPLVAQLVKNLAAMQETLIQFLGQEVPLEKG